MREDGSDEDMDEQGVGYLAEKDQQGSSIENIYTPYKHIRCLLYNEEDQDLLVPVRVPWPACQA